MEGLEGADRPGGNQEGRKMGVITDNGKNGDEKGASSISRHFGAAELQFVPGANNPRYLQLT